MRTTDWSTVITIMLVLAVVVSFIFMILDLNYQTQYFSNYVPELLAGFLGIGLALSFEQSISERRERSKADDLQSALLEELQQIKSWLEKGLKSPIRALQVPNRLWTMAIMSGDLAILERTARQNIYLCNLNIEAYNYKSEILTQLQIEGNCTEDEEKEHRKLLDRNAEKICLMIEDTQQELKK